MVDLQLTGVALSRKCLPDKDISKLKMLIKKIRRTANVFSLIGFLEIIETYKRLDKSNRILLEGKERKVEPICKIGIPLSLSNFTVSSLV